jgi:hypothetical protein
VPGLVTNASFCDVCLVWWPPRSAFLMLVCPLAGVQQDHIATYGSHTRVHECSFATCFIYIYIYIYWGSHVDIRNVFSIHWNSATKGYRGSGGAMGTQATASNS